MKVILLAGGLGTRLSEYTDTIPKPMVEIGGKPMLWHIMNLFARYNHKNFYVALGYKGEVVKKYFSKIAEEWNINLVDTGQKTMTGGRVKRLQKVVGNETCMLTYGDGVSDVASFKFALSPSPVVISLCINSSRVSTISSNLYVLNSDTYSYDFDSNVSVNNNTNRFLISEMTSSWCFILSTTPSFLKKYNFIFSEINLSNNADNVSIFVIYFIYFSTSIFGKYFKNLSFLLSLTFLILFLISS